MYLQDTNDHMGQATAQLNLSELSRQLGYPEDAAATGGAVGSEAPLANVNGNKGAGGAAASAARRKSMEQLDLLKMTPDQKGKRPPGGGADLNKSGLLDEEDFFDFISRYVAAPEIPVMQKADRHEVKYETSAASK